MAKPLSALEHFTLIPQVTRMREAQLKYIRAINRVAELEKALDCFYLAVRNQGPPIKFSGRFLVCILKSWWARWRQQELPKRTIRPSIKKQSPQSFSTPVGVEHEEPAQTLCTPCAQIVSSAGSRGIPTACKVWLESADGLRDELMETSRTAHETAKEYKKERDAYAELYMEVRGVTRQTAVQMAYRLCGDKSPKLSGEDDG